MRLTCPGCAYAADVPDAQLPPAGTRARCPSCQAAFVFTPQGLAAVDPDATPPHGTDAVPATGWRIRTVHGEQEGLDAARVREMIRKDELTPEDEVAPPGEPHFRRAGEVKELARYFALKAKAPPPAVAAAPDALQACQRHATARGAWLCMKCPALWCEACVISRSMGTVQGVKVCPACDEACRPVAAPKVAPLFLEDAKGLFLFPLRGLAWLGLVLCALVEIMAALARHGGLYGLIAQVVLGCSLFAYLLFIVRHGAAGKPGLPDLGEVGDIMSDMVWPGLKGISVTVLVLVPMFSYQCFVMPRVGVFREAPVEVVDGVDLNDPDLALTEAQKSRAREYATVQGELRGTFGAPEAAEPGEGGAEAEEPADEPEETDSAPSSPSDADRLRELDQESGWQLPSLLRMVKPVHVLAHLVLIAYAVALLPMLLIIVALFNTIAPALNPSVVFGVIGEVKGEYAKLVLFVAGMLVAETLVSGPFLGIPFAGFFIASVVSFYFRFVTFHAMGRFARWMDTKVDLS